MSITPKQFLKIHAGSASKHVRQATWEKRSKVAPKLASIEFACDCYRAALRHHDPEDTPRHEVRRWFAHGPLDDALFDVVRDSTTSKSTSCDATWMLLVRLLDHVYSAAMSYESDPEDMEDFWDVARNLEAPVYWKDLFQWAELAQDSVDYLTTAYGMDSLRGDLYAFYVEAWSYHRDVVFWEMRKRLFNNFDQESED